METRQTRWPGLGVPPSHDPAPALGWTGTLTGRRVIIATADGWWTDYRATGEAALGRDGRPVVPVCAESRWYKARFDGHAVRPYDVHHWPLQDVWIESGQVRF